MKAWSKYVIGLLVVMGGCIGSVWLPTLLNITQDSGILLGIGLGFLISILIPSLWKSFLETVNSEHQEAIAQNRYISFKNMLTHPTTLPILLGSIWLVICISIILLFNLNSNQTNTSIFVFTPFFISLGLSGTAMFKKREIVIGEWFGRYLVKRTNLAIVLGVLYIAIGFGSGIIFVLSVVFNW